MSLFTVATNKLHNNLIETGTSTLTSNLVTGAASGAVLDGGFGIYNGGGVGSSLTKGAVKGSFFHGAYKALGTQYTKGVSSEINKGISTMTNNATKAVRSDFKLNHFTNTEGSSFKGTGMFDALDVTQVPFQKYNK